jgi:hypothetical protein
MEEIDIEDIATHQKSIYARRPARMSKRTENLLAIVTGSLLAEKSEYGDKDGLLDAAAKFVKNIEIEARFYRAIARLIELETKLNLKRAPTHFFRTTKKGDVLFVHDGTEFKIGNPDIEVLDNMIQRYEEDLADQEAEEALLGSIRKKLSLDEIRILRGEREPILEKLNHEEKDYISRNWG